MDSVTILLALIVAIYFIYFGGKYLIRIYTPKKVTNNNQILHFKDKQSAFDYACKYWDNGIEENKGVVAIVKEVLPLIGENGTPETRYLLLVANDAKGFLTVSTTIIPNSPILKIDDLVIWVPYTYLNDTNCWFGFIKATIAPAISTKTGWVILDKF